MHTALNLILGGLGAGTAIAAYLLSLAGGISRGDLIVPYAVSGAIMALGLLCVWTKTGSRPRSAGLLLRPLTSWQAGETYAALAYFAALAADWLMPGPLLDLLIATAAALFLVCQARLVRASKSRPAWRAREVPSLLVIAALAEGVGLIAILGTVAPFVIRSATWAPIAGMVLAMMGAYRWREYSGGLIAKDSDSSIGVELAKVSPLIHMTAHALPFTLYLAALLPWPDARWLAALGGLTAIAASALWKSILVTRLGRSRDFSASPIGL